VFGKKLTILYKKLMSYKGSNIAEIGRSIGEIVQKIPLISLIACFFEELLTC